jgi:ankyrin repeat protein
MEFIVKKILLIALSCTSILVSHAETKYVKNTLFDIHSVKAAKRALDSGANINELDGLGETPLHKAVKNYNYEAVRFLIDNGADINIVNDSGETLLHAIDYSKTGAYVMLLMLIDNGCTNVNTKGGTYKLTPIIYAVYEENIEAMNTLIKAGADLTIKDNCGETVLHKAINLKSTVARLSATNLLIKSGANVNAQACGGFTPLHIVQYFDTAEILINAKANLSIRDHDGETALHHATRSPYGRIIKLREDRLKTTSLLIKYGADVNATNKDGVTPIRYSNCLLIMEILIKAGANIYCNNNSPSKTLKEILDKVNSGIAVKDFYRIKI